MKRIKVSLSAANTIYVLCVRLKGKDQAMKGAKKTNFPWQMGKAWLGLPTPEVEFRKVILRPMGDLFCWLDFGPYE
jgi:hypothetical protein